MIGKALSPVEAAAANDNRRAVLKAIEERAASVKAWIAQEYGGGLPCNCGNAISYVEAARDPAAASECRFCGGRDPKIARPAHLGPMSPSERRRANVDARRRETAAKNLADCERKLEALREHYREVRARPLSDFFSEDPTRAMKRAAVRANLMSGWAAGKKAAADLAAMRPESCTDCGTAKPAAHVCPNCGKDPFFNQVFRRI